MSEQLIMPKTGPHEPQMLDGKYTHERIWGFQDRFPCFDSRFDSRRAVDVALEPQLLSCQHWQRWPVFWRRPTLTTDWTRAHSVRLDKAIPFAGVARSPWIGFEG